MKINSVTGYCNNNIKHYGKNVHQTPSFGTARVDKSIMRFYEFNEKRLPTSVKDFLSIMPDKFALSPLELQRKAYEKLNIAKTVNDVQNLFPNEELFIYLESLKDTKACNGLLGLYREFKDLFENGILKEDLDFTVYLLRKSFVEAKTLDEINLDLEEDLNPDIKTEFKRRYPNGQYLRSSTLKALGIYLPDIGYQNSLKFTREGYSDSFGLKISEAQLRYWNNLSEDQKFEILSRRCEGRDNWWNSLSYNEKLEYAARVDSEDDLFSNYKSFVRLQKRKSNTENIIGNIKLTRKKINIGSAKLKDKDIFVLWMKKNIERFYANLSERDKDTVHLKRVRRLTVRWQEMTPEERTELIQKMREEREPIRFAMIDAWNHYPELIKELSAFLKSQQIFKPVDLLYSSQEFSEFQSKVMTEFWANHRDMAEIFGEKIRDAQARVEDALLHGQFDDLKQEILRNRAYRIKMFEHERLAAERAKALQATEDKTAEVEEPVIAEKISDYKADFSDALKRSYDPDNVLPKLYIKDMSDFYTEIMPEEALKECTQLMKEDKPIFELTSKYIKEAENKEIAQNAKKYETALSFAIANELYSQGATSDVYKFPVDTLIGMIQSNSESKSLFKNPIKLERIANQYEEFRKDLSDEEANLMVNNYFTSKTGKLLTSDENKAFAEYLSTYGRTLLILFSNKSAYSDEVKIAFLENFMERMPQKVKNSIRPFLENAQNIKNEKEIASIRRQLTRRLGFLPAEFSEIYTQELATQIRMFANPYDESIEKTYTKEEYNSIAKTFSVDYVKKAICQKSTFKDPKPFAVMDKNTFLDDVKLKMLAIEQAMADEVYRISKDDRMHNLSFESLVNLFEILSGIGIREKVKLSSEDGKSVYYFSGRPETKFLQIKYKRYYNELKERINTEKLDKEEILFVLNPEENRPEKDNYIMQRINQYF